MTIVRNNEALFFILLKKKAHIPICFYMLLVQSFFPLYFTVILFYWDHVLEILLLPSS